MLQDLSLVVSGSFPGRRLRISLGELIVDPDKVGKQKPEEDSSHDHPEEVVISGITPIDDSVLHVPSLLYR
jgi:hypothetical protein